VFVAIISLVAAGCGSDGPTANQPTGTRAPTTPPLRIVEVVSGLDAPLQVVALPGAREDLLIIEQAGRVRRVRDGTLQAGTILDISSEVRSGGEQGLLSMALHPDVIANGRVFIHMSDRAGDTLVAEHRFDGERIAATPTRVLLQVDQPFTNHNGGSLAFGPDGLLYLGLGDGGSANDPQGNGQDLATRLGKLLRRDVDDPSADWQIAAYGLRNPWRFAFDPSTGDAWIGDVGQNALEEVDVFPRGSGLLNFGWDVYEGRSRVGSDDDLDRSGTLTEPVAQYDHDDGCSITGGVVVRNPALPSLDGRYVYGDFCSGAIWTLPVEGTRTSRRETVTVDDLVSIDAGADGAVYVTSQSGTVSRFSE
jgi:glucose/arabinose dehydrogenase